jgi:hypothetical protein
MEDWECAREMSDKIVRDGVVMKKEKMVWRVAVRVRTRGHERKLDNGKE